MYFVFFNISSIKHMDLSWTIRYKHIYTNIPIWFKNQKFLKHEIRLKTSSEIFIESICIDYYCNTLTFRNTTEIQTSIKYICKEKIGSFEYK